MIHFKRIWLNDKEELLKITIWRIFPHFIAGLMNLTVLSTYLNDTRNWNDYFHINLLKKPKLITLSGFNYFSKFDYLLGVLCSYLWHIFQPSYLHPKLNGNRWRIWFSSGVLTYLKRRKVARISNAVLRSIVLLHFYW